MSQMDLIFPFLLQASRENEEEDKLSETTYYTNNKWSRDELVDLVTNDWVMKTKTTIYEIHCYLDDNDPDPFRNFYLIFEIPNNITRDDMEFYD